MGGADHEASERGIEGKEEVSKCAGWGLSGGVGVLITIKPRD